MTAVKDMTDVELLAYALHIEGELRAARTIAQVVRRSAEEHAKRERPGPGGGRWTSVAAIMRQIEGEDAAKAADDKLVAEVDAALAAQQRMTPGIEPLDDLPPLGVVGQYIVRTVRAVRDDLEPRSLPPIPRGTFGICPDDDTSGYPLVDFGPPWGYQRVGNHDLVDAPAVLFNAMRAIALLGRPWRQVIARTLRSFAGPYLVTTAGGRDSAVERRLAGKGRRASLRLLAQAADLASHPGSKAWAREQGEHFIAESRKKRTA